MRYNFSCLIFESQLFDVDLYFKFNITNQKLMHQNQNQPQSSNTLTNPYSFGSVGISLGAGNHNNIHLNGNTGNQNHFGSGQSSSNNGANNGYNNNLNSIDVFSSCFTASSTSGASKESINLFPQSVGLLEVLPLNYKFFSCSNGTQMEKSNQKQETNLYVLPDFFSFFDKQQSGVSFISSILLN